MYNTWLADSGTQSHVVRDRDLFLNYRKTPGAIISGAGETSALGRGDVPITMRYKNKFTSIMLKDVIHAPDMPVNLISLSRMTKGGCAYVGNGDKLSIFDGDDIIGEAILNQDLYQIDVVPDMKSIGLYGRARSWFEWHCILGHKNIAQLQELHSKGMVDGMNVDTKSRKNFVCEACIQAKQTKEPYSTEPTTEYTEIGQMIVSDIWGKSDVPGIDGSEFMVTFTDVYSRRTQVYFLKHRDEACERFKQYRAMLRQQTGKDIKVLRTDNALEYTRGQFKDYLDREGIICQTTGPYGSAENGIAERLNRTLLESGRAMSFRHNLPRFLWPEAVSYAAYIRNRVPTRALNGKTPEEMFTGRKPDISNLREFGVDCWVLILPTPGKLQRKSMKAVFTGVSDNSRAYRYWDRGRRRILISRNVKFVTDYDVQGAYGEIEDSQIDESQNDVPESRSEINDDATASDTPETSNSRKRMIDEDEESSNEMRRSNRIAKRPRVDYDALANPRVNVLMEHAFIAMTDQPQTYNEVRKRSDWPKWNNAMNKELTQLEELKTYELTDLPPNRKEIGCRWVLVIKRNAKQEIVKYKARLVAQGFSQIPGQDFNQTYAPVMRAESFRTILAICAQKNYVLHQVDVVGAYLNGVLDEEIYMRQPPGFEDGTGRVWKLKKALYGLKQAGRVWNKTLVDALKKIGFHRLESDKCVFIRFKDGELELIGVHVDDMLIAAPNDDLANQIKAEIETIFNITDLGHMREYLGMEIHRNPETGSITLRQTGYIETMLNKFGLDDANIVHMPLDPNSKIVDMESSERADVPYQQAVGCLLWLSTISRPDITFAAHALAQYNNQPTQASWQAVKRVMRYLKGTKDLGLVYERSPNFDLVGFCDADWGGARNGRSVSGFIFKIGSAAITWSSRKQTSTAASTMEAEYIALSETSKEVTWLRYLLAELRMLKTNTPTTIYTDNKAAIAFSHDDQFHAKTKHILIRYHITRERIEEGVIDVIYVKSEDNHADIFTKPLARPSHVKQRAAIGMRVEGAC